MLLFYKKILEEYLADDKAATAIEYGLIAAGIAVAISAVIFSFGDIMAENFSSSSDLIAERNAD